MENKIYKVITRETYIEQRQNYIEVKIFLDKKLALKYMEEKIKRDKQNVEPDEIDDYKYDESDEFYERYLEDRAFEESVCIYLEEDTICKELEYESKKAPNKKAEKENDYEM